MQGHRVPFFFPTKKSTVPTGEDEGQIKPAARACDRDREETGPGPYHKSLKVVIFNCSTICIENCRAFV